MGPGPPPTDMLTRRLLGQLGARARKADVSHLSVLSGDESILTEWVLLFSHWGARFSFNRRKPGKSLPIGWLM